MLTHPTRMSHQECQRAGTDLRDVFDILLKAPSERLHSLTIQLGESPEEKIILALCLVLLRRPAQALRTLQTLEDHTLACHLAEQWQTGPFYPETLGDHCSGFRALTRETLAALARIFKVLTEQRLCDQQRRDLAYKRVISNTCQKAGTYDDWHYDRFKEEARVVCGPQVAEWLCSSTPSGSFSSSHTLLEGATLKLCESQTHHQTSSQEALSSTLSFPTHLEMSIPPTVSFRGDRFASKELGRHNLSHPSVLAKTKDALDPPVGSDSCEREPQSAERSQSAAKKASVTGGTSADSSLNRHETNVQPKCEPPAVTDVSLPESPAPRETPQSTEEEEEVFYAFVILHAPEDTDVAESMKEKLEGVVGNDGATFSGDFAIPGKSTLKCVEDAINNSAFTFLLLTRNFNTRMLDVKTNTALMNAISKEHKYNTVIPLLPRENCMPRRCIPLVLQTIVPLEENRNFEKKIQRSLAPAKIEKQRRKWNEEQRLQKQEKLKVSQHALTENRGLSIEHKVLIPELWTNPPNICIQNAKYIMIGNDSQMTVGVGDGGVKEDAVCTKEEQHS